METNSHSQNPQPGASLKISFPRTTNQSVPQKKVLFSTTAVQAPLQTGIPNLPPIKDSALDNLCGLGNPSGPGQYPWVVALYKRGNYIGGGSLIAPGVVLTAAHLVMNISANEIVVRAGEWDMASTSEQFRHEERSVVRVEPHEDFSFEASTNNIALLYLKSPLELKAHIRTICLPGEGKTFDQKSCLMAGWGKRSFQDPYNSSKQKSVEMPMVKREDCQNQFRRTRLHRNFELHESLICAGGQRDKDACTADDGSPLFCALDNDPNRYEQAGIVSFGIGCSQANVPGTFTNVAMFRDYIDEKLAGGTFEL
nr:phenoloxidase-activating factor 2-like [Drosophila takahashii]